MILTMHTIGSADLNYQILNSVVMTLNDKGFTQLKQLTMMVSGFMALIYAVLNRNIFSYMRWLVKVLMIVYLCLIPKVTLLIVDSEVKQQVYRIDNIPVSLAAIASGVTTLGFGLTQILQQYFSMPGDPMYTKTGMLFPSQLIIETSRLTIRDPIFKKNITAYMKTCVFYDLLLEKYTNDELLKSHDVWQFLLEHASQSRVVEYNNDIMTCRQSIHKLDADWKNVIDQSTRTLQRTFFPAKKLQNQYMNTLISSSYQYLTNTAMDATSILQNQLLVNELDSSLTSFVQYDLGLNARVNLSYTQSNENMKILYNTYSRMALKWLPMIRNSIESIMLASWMFVILFSFFSAGSAVMKSYLQSLVWLQLWSPLYAILHYIGSFYANLQAGALAERGIRFSQQVQFAQLNEDMISVVGYLTLSIPFIAAGLMNGFMQTFVSASQHFMSGIQSSVGSSSESVSSGNISQGNIQMNNIQYGNQQMSNTQGFNHDTRMSYKANSTTEQLPSGAEFTSFSDGNSLINETPTYSGIGVEMISREKIASESREKSVTSWQNFDQFQENATEHYSRALNHLDDLQLTRQHRDENANADSLQYSHSIEDITSQLNESYRGFENRFHTDRSTTKSIFSAMMSDQKAGIQFDAANSAVGKVVASCLGANINAGVNLGAHEEKSRTSSNTTATLTDQIKGWAKSTNFAHHVSDLESAMNTKEDIHSDAKQSDKVHTIRNEIHRASASSESQVKSMERAQYYEKMSEKISDQSFELANSREQDFHEWMLLQPSRFGTGTISASELDTILHDNQETQHYVALFRDQTVEKFWLDNPIDDSSKRVVESHLKKGNALYNRVMKKRKG